MSKRDSALEIELPSADRGEARQHLEKDEVVWQSQIVILELMLSAAITRKHLFEGSLCVLCEELARKLYIASELWSLRSTFCAQASEGREERALKECYRIRR